MREKFAVPTSYFIKNLSLEVGHLLFLASQNAKQFPNI
jgi:hypothetical protein